MDRNQLVALDRELVEIEIPAKPVTVVAAGDAGKGEPAFVIYVKPVSPEELAELNKIPTDLIQRGFRRNGKNYDAAMEEHAAKKRAKWIADVLEHHWDGATLANINYLLRAARVQLDPEKMPTIKALFASGAEAEFSPSLCDLFWRKCRDEDWDQVIGRAASSWAEEYLAEQQGNASA